MSKIKSLLYGIAAIAGLFWLPHATAQDAVMLAGLGGFIMVKNLPFANVVASGKATVTLRNVLGYTVNRVLLVLGGTALTKAMITSVIVKINGKVIFDDTGTNLDKRMKFRTITDNAAYLTLDFTEIKARTIVGMLMGAIDTSFGVEDISIEVTISGATAPTLESYALLDAPQVDEAGKSLPFRGLIAKVLRYPASFSAGGKQSVVLPFGDKQGSLIKRLHFFHGGNMTGLEMKKNGLTIHETIAAVNSFQLQEFGRTPQTNVYSVDFVMDGNQSNMLNTRDARNMEVYPTLSASDNLDIYAEYLDPLGNN